MIVTKNEPRFSFHISGAGFDFNFAELAPDQETARKRLVEKLKKVIAELEA